VGVEQGIILAIILSIIDLLRRQYSPKRFVVGVERDGVRNYEAAEPGTQSAPGLLIFRYDADLFYANVNRMCDDVQRLFLAAPDPVRWLVLDCSVTGDADYSAGRALNGLVDFVHGHDAVFSLAAADTGLIHSLEAYGVIQRLDPQHVYPTLADAIEAFRASTSTG